MFFVIAFPPARDEEQAGCRSQIRDSWALVEIEREPAPA